MLTWIATPMSCSEGHGYDYVSCVVKRWGWQGLQLRVWTLAAVTAAGPAGCFSSLTIACSRAPHGGRCHCSSAGWADQWLYGVLLVRLDKRYSLGVMSAQF
ncbi:hypothetical protein Vretimale_17280 [Volvox reticuliferus]|uniref:Uncharacterized protein n=1 Tax=Volvox reticuliferus TaxID=1737510 RepID=A0A8J4GUF8_9CHLO|nr:hypothetical protein Vretimale_17280 [Volvox reticuliferus]